MDRCRHDKTKKKKERESDLTDRLSGQVKTWLLACGPARLRAKSWRLWLRARESGRVAKRAFLSALVFLFFSASAVSATGAGAAAAGALFFFFSFLVGAGAAAAGLLWASAKRGRT